MMMIQSDISNKLLKKLSPNAFMKIAVYLQPIQLPIGFKLIEPKQICTQFVFPNTGVASVIGVMSEVWQEIGLFGVEGMGPASTILSQAHSPDLVVMQIAGEGCCIDVAHLRELFDADAEIRELLLAYAAAFIVQLSHTAVANVQCNATVRLARWLLMIQDRTLSNQVSLTPACVAAMLGVGRVIVMLALRDLETEELISTDDKIVRIHNRTGILAKATQYYGTPEREYTNIMAARVYGYN